MVGIYSPSEVKVLIEQFGDELPTIAAFGEATAFYNDLYRAGLLGDDFGCSADYCGPIAMAVLGFLVLLSMWNTKSDGYEHDAAETN